MPQDAFTLRFIAKELNDNLTGGKISRITQPSRDTLIFLIYTQKGTVKLTTDFSAKFCRASLNEGYDGEAPAVAPNFCMLLRKHLSNAQILSVGQVGFERVLYIDFKCFSEFEICDMRLYLEIMGKYSNAVLTKEEIIVGALKSTSLECAKRVMFTGAKYRLPDRQDKADPTDIKELEKAFTLKSGDTARFIAEHVAGIAYVTAEDIAAKYGDNLTYRQLYDYIFSDEKQPCITFENGRAQDFKVRYLKGAQTFGSALEAQAEFYTQALNERYFADKKRKLLSALSSAVKKVEKRLAQIADKLTECDKAEEIKLKGELITANIYAVERGASSFEAVNYYDENCGKVRIELDPRLTPSQNAQKYYKRYAKLKRTAENLLLQKEECERKDYYLKSIESSLTLSEGSEDLKGCEEELISLCLLPPIPRKKGVKTVEASPFRTYSFEGFKVLCGRNNSGNDKLVKLISADDIWLHAKSFHSSHAAILTDGKEATDGVIKFAAEICAYYSEARGKDKVAIDYTQRKHVKKPNGASLGFVTYTDFKTIIVAPDAHSEDRKDE